MGIFKKVQSFPTVIFEMAFHKTTFMENVFENLKIMPWWLYFFIRFRVSYNDHEEIPYWKTIIGLQKAEILMLKALIVKTAMFLHISESKTQL